MAHVEVGLEDASIDTTTYAQTIGPPQAHAGQEWEEGRRPGRVGRLSFVSARVGRAAPSHAG
jgi:hypothetical protein